MVAPCVEPAVLSGSKMSRQQKEMVCPVTTCLDSPPSLSPSSSWKTPTHPPKPNSDVSLFQNVALLPYSTAGSSLLLLNYSGHSFEVSRQHTREGQSQERTWGSVVWHLRNEEMGSEEVLGLYGALETQDGDVCCGQSSWVLWLRGVSPIDSQSWALWAGISISLPPSSASCTFDPELVLLKVFTKHPLVGTHKGLSFWSSQSTRECNTQDTLETQLMLRKQWCQASEAGRPASPCRGGVSGPGEMVWREHWV